MRQTSSSTCISQPLYAFNHIIGLMNAYILIAQLIYIIYCFACMAFNSVPHHYLDIIFASTKKLYIHVCVRVCIYMQNWYKQLQWCIARVSKLAGHTASIIKFLLAAHNQYLVGLHELYLAHPWLCTWAVVNLSWTDLVAS